MGIIRSKIRIVCALAFLLMAGGQAYYSCVDLACDRQQAMSASCPDPQDCPDGHSCGHAHAGIQLAMVENSEFLFMATPSGSCAIDGETCGEGPCREIDHPPQLA